MSVPEAAVHEDDAAVSAEHDVRRPRQAADVHPVAVAPPPQLAPHLQLGTCVLAADVRHAEMALLEGERVGHGGCPNDRILLGVECNVCV